MESHHGPLHGKIGLVDADKMCSKCGSEKPITEFHKDKNSLDGHVYWCKVCVTANGRRHHTRRMQEDPSYALAKRSSYIKNRHGLVLEEYEKMILDQGCECFLCQEELELSGSGTHLDHSHKTGKLRKMLCTNCNRGLGHFKDNPEVLERAARYLREYP